MHGPDKNKFASMNMNQCFQDYMVQGLNAIRLSNLKPQMTSDLYRLLVLVERCFSKLKYTRRIAARHNKTAESFIDITFDPLLDPAFVNLTYLKEKKLSSREPNQKSRVLNIFVATC